MWRDFITQKMCNTMAWKTIPAKSIKRNYAPTIRLKDGTLYLSAAAYALLCKSVDDKYTYIRFLENTESKAVYVSQSTAKEEDTIRIPSHSKGTKADLLQEFLQRKYGKVNKFIIEKNTMMNRREGKTFMINPMTNGK